MRGCRGLLGCIALGTCLLGVACSGLQAQESAAAPGASAVESLQAHLKALKDVRTLSCRFVCEKRLALLDSPLVSSGKLWIAKAEAGSGGGGGAGGGPGQGGGVRFSTDKPYGSELILSEGKVHARSQHETDWTTTNQSGRPGLTAIMVQLGGWLTGDAGKLTEMYTVTQASAGASVPALPDGQGAAGAGHGVKMGGEGLDIFVLTPTNKDLAIAIKQIELAIDRGSHQLLSVQITSQQDDRTRYWFYDVQLNPSLPPDIFKPGAKGEGGGGEKP